MHEKRTGVWIVPSVMCMTLAILLLVTATGRAVAQVTPLVVEGDNVGIGTTTPQYPLHLVRTDPAIGSMLVIENTGQARITFHNTSAAGQWSFGQENNDRFVVNRAGTGTQEFAVTPSGNIMVGASVVHSSSRETKEGFKELDPREVLAKLAEIPISEWSYKQDETAVRHVGPMAEDFYAAFGLGDDDKHIAIDDSAGVALVAIQGLRQLFDEKDGEIRRLDEAVARKDVEIEELSRRLARLEERLDDEHGVVGVSATCGEPVAMLTVKAAQSDRGGSSL